MLDHASGTVLAFDFGEKRIGVAVAEVSIGIAHPLAPIHAEDNKIRFAAIAAQIAEWKPTHLIVGEPHHADGGAHEIARLARRFAQRLEGRLREQGLRGEKLKALLDSAAAGEILQTWLAQQRLVQR